MSGSSTYQYLQAMGINSWVCRDAQPVEHPVHSGETNGPPAETTAPAAVAPVEIPEQRAQSIATWAGSDLEELTGSQRVTLDRVVESGKLLLVVERTLTLPEEDLLSAMLKAIHVDRLAQSIATVVQTTGTQLPGTESMSELCARLTPSIVVVMATLSDSQNVSELDDHRKALHQFAWLNVPVAITLHPQVLLDNPQGKRPAWEDLKRVKAFLDG